MAQKRTKRRKSPASRKKTTGSMLPWYAVACLAIGGIATHGQWSNFVPHRWMQETKSQPSQSVAQSVTHPQSKSVPAAVAQPSRQSVTLAALASLPTPPAPIPSSGHPESAKPAVNVVQRPTTVPVPAPTPVSLVTAAASAPAASATLASRRFGVCGEGQHANCVIDGNTFWAEGIRIRLADIEAPEAGAPRCPEEQRLGAAARARLVSLLNDGTFAISPSGYRDQDPDGSKLRLIMREGRSVGDQLVKEGLARHGATHASWCTRA